MRRLLASLLGGALLAGSLLVGPALAAEEPAYDELWSFADPAIVESSGLVVTDEHVITVNDSGDSGRVFTVSLETGETVGVTRWSDEPRDVEALAPAGAGHVWVGDIGDNRRVRSSIEVLRVPVGAGDRTVTPERYELRYPERAADAETLLADPGTGRLYVVTKGVFGGEVFAAPAELDPDGPNRLTSLGPVTGMATDGSFFAGGRHLVIRTYGRAVVYSWPSLESVGSFRTPAQQQGEGIAAGPDDSVYVSSEGLRSPFLRLELPAEVRTALAAPASSAASPPDAAAPSAGASTGSADDSGDEPGADGSGSDGSGASETDGFVDAAGEEFRRDPWPWVAGTLVGLVALLVLVRSLRPPG